MRRGAGGDPEQQQLLDARAAARSAATQSLAGTSRSSRPWRVRAAATGRGGARRRAARRRPARARRGRPASTGSARSTRSAPKQPAHVAAAARRARARRRSGRPRPRRGAGRRRPTRRPCRGRGPRSAPRCEPDAAADPVARLEHERRSWPRASSSRAATSPARPAPITITSATREVSPRGQAADADPRARLLARGAALAPAGGVGVVEQRVEVGPQPRRLQAELLARARVVEDDVHVEVRQVDGAVLVRGRVAERARLARTAAAGGRSARRRARRARRRSPRRRPLTRLNVPVASDSISLKMPSAT